MQRKVPSLARGPQRSQLWHRVLVGTTVLTLCHAGLVSQEGILPMRSRVKHPLSLLNGRSRADATRAAQTYLLAVP